MDMAKETYQVTLHLEVSKNQTGVLFISSENVEDIRISVSVQTNGSFHDKVKEAVTHREITNMEGMILSCFV